MPVKGIGALETLVRAVGTPNETGERVGTGREGHGVGVEAPAAEAGPAQGESLSAQERGLVTRMGP